MKLSKPKIYRQGDVLFTRIPELPRGERKKRSNGTVAYGEVTGHSHRLSTETMDQAEVLEIGEGLFVKVSDDGVAIFTHEEHKPIELPAGNYEVKIQREYKPDMSERVRD